MNVIQDLDLLILQVGTEEARKAGTRVKAYIYLVTLAFLVCLVGWVAS